MVSNKKSVLWICGIAWLREDDTYFPEATTPGIVSASAFQQAMIEGLEAQDYSVRILSGCSGGTGSRLEWSHNGKSNDIRVAGSANKLWGLLVKTLNLCKELKKGDVLADVRCVCAYEMHLPYLLSIRRIKKTHPEIKTVLICPDLSIYMDLNVSHKPIKAFLKKVENMLARRLLRSVDGYVLFTEQMQDYFAEFQKPYAVVEGVYRDKYSLQTIPKKNFIMHAGSLHYNTGIEELIAAFEQIPDNTQELWFFGSGAMDGYIREKAAANPRIRHMGFVDPKTLFEYEKQATLLVNVRDPKAEYTQYSFPSKTFEYMASGTPFLTTDLPGIPKEYKEHLLIVPDNNVDAVRTGFIKALSMTEQERSALGLRAQAFVLERKNKMIQSGKIADFLTRLV